LNYNYQLELVKMNYQMFYNIKQIKLIFKKILWKLKLWFKKELNNNLISNRFKILFFKITKNNYFYNNKILKNLIKKLFLKVRNNNNRDLIY